MLQPGTAVDRYTIEHLLGEGGMASVYAVKHQVLGTRHALKVLHTTAPGVRERLVREGRLQARLDPAHVVQVTDVLDVGGAPALLMPLVRGCSLAEVLEDHRLSEGEVAALFAGVVAGVASAHAAGVIHRDLKPANVLLEVKRGVVVVRVADFGLARPQEEDHTQTRTGVFMGTPAYAAPEQLLDMASVDHRADLWSLGVMLYELLTGERPFKSDSLAGLMVAVTRGEMDADAVSEAWRPVVAGLLALEREDRMASAEMVSAALSTVATPTDLVIGGPVAEVIRRRVDAAEVAARVASASPATQAGLAETVAPQPAVRHNLPRERDPFVGRDADLATLHQRLGDGSALVSVLGIGGTGKTRLVLHYGWQHRADWPGGVWFCDLSEARSVEGIAAAVARALDVPLGKDDPITQLGHAIAGRGRCLVLLDNFEQVARHARETLGPWLDRATEAAFVVTTREVLGLPGEAAIPLAPLSATDSIALFRVRAEAAKPGFTPDADEVEAIEALVTLLDDLPLAIELAAARVRVLGPRKLLSRMSDRFRVLTSAGGRRDRQATLRATLDWSWDLLADWEQSALAQVSVFEGGFDLEAAEAVVDLDALDEAPWAMDAVQALVDKSLVRPVGDDRFDLLVSVQVYAAEKLEASGERADAEMRHGAWYAGFGTQAALDAGRVHGGVARRRALARELDNAVVACRRAVARGDGAVAATTFRAAWAVLKQTGPVAVGEELVASALEVHGLAATDRVILTTCAGEALWMLGRMDEARAHYDAALAAARKDLAGRGHNRWAEGHVLDYLGLLCAERGRWDEARTHYDAALGVAREIGNRELEAIVLTNLGILHSRQRRRDEARAHYDAALAAAREVGNRAREGIVLGNLANLHLDQGRWGEARAHYDTALGVAREVGNRWGEGALLGNLGLLCAHQGRMDEARTHFDAALAVHREVGDRRLEGQVLGNLGGLHKAQGRAKEAQAHFEAALAVARERGDRRAEGISLGNLGTLHLEQGRMDEARACFESALRLHREVQFTYGQGYWLWGLARLESLAGSDTWDALADEAVAVSSDFPLVHAEALAVRATLRLTHGRTADARDDVDAARALGQAGDVAARVALADARTLLAERRPDAARASVEEAQALADGAHLGADSPVGVELTEVRALLGEAP